jgi:hypothetical protein
MVANYDVADPIPIIDRDRKAGEPTSNNLKQVAPAYWKLDRLARSMKQLIETIESLRLRGIGFRSLTEAIDTTTPQGVLVFHMFSALAEFERALIRERTRA